MHGDHVKGFQGMQMPLKADHSVTKKWIYGRVKPLESKGFRLLIKFHESPSFPNL